MENKLSYECKQCHSRTSLRSGTVMSHSKLPFRYWLIAIHLLTATKKSFSTEEFRRQLGDKRYQPISLSKQSLRRSIRFFPGFTLLSAILKGLYWIHIIVSKTNIYNFTSTSSVINSIEDIMERNYSTDYSG